MAIFTKFDDFITQVYDRKKEEEENRKVAYATLEEKFMKVLEGYKFPPRAYVQFECVFCYPYRPILALIAFPAIDEDEGNHQEQVGKLIKQTAVSIDDLALKMLFVTIQQNNLEVCIENAMNRSVIHPFIVAFAYLSFQVYLCIYPNSGTCFLELQRYENSNEQRQAWFSGLHHGLDIAMIRYIRQMYHWGPRLMLRRIM